MKHTVKSAVDYRVQSYLFVTGHAAKLPNLSFHACMGQDSEAKVVIWIIPGGYLDE